MSEKINTTLILDFLSDLQMNNSYEWMKENKPTYLKAKKEFELFLQSLILSISDFDKTISHLQSKDLVFRLNRDTRFSIDKSPYNASFRAHISAAGRTPIPAGYYINIQPGNCFLGGGVFATAFPDAITMVRDYLVLHSEEFMSIVSDKMFSDHFTVVGRKLKRVPNGYDKDHPLAEYLKHKSWDVEYHITDEQFKNTNEIMSFTIEKFHAMKPLNDYLNMALKDFKMPTRK
jgi:uncharacterized protein (TIGR02453 family)